jgi:hypothetical protein
MAQIPRALDGVAGHARLAWLVGLSLGGLLCGQATANPTVAEACLVDIRPAPARVTHCGEMIQHTTEAGRQIFTAFYYPLYLVASGEVGVDRLTAEFWWPEAWGLAEARPPQEGSGTLTQVAPNRCRLEWSWPACPRFDPGEHEAFPLASFVLDVTSEGYFQCMTLDGALCFPTGAVMFGGAAGDGHAGVTCGYCDAPCDLSNPQQPSVEPRVLELESDHGQSVSGTFWVWLDELPDVVYECGAPWLTCEEEIVGPTERMLHVTADPSALGPGRYETLVSATVGCKTCASVVFTVLPVAQGIPEPGSTGAENPAETESPPVWASWGRMKDLNSSR